MEIKMPATRKKFAARLVRGRSFSNLIKLVVLAVAIGFATLLESGPSATAQETRSFPFRNDGISVASIRQMSAVISTASGIIVTDPTGRADRYLAYGQPDLILVSHEHGEHYDTRTLEDLAGPQTRIVVTPYVMERLPDALRDRAVSLPNGESATLGDIGIEAVAAYGLGSAAAQWHPQGRGNSYLVTVGGQRLFIAGSTEAVPEMLALRDLDLMLLPLYPPYAFGPEDAVQALAEIGPESVYVYQYNSTRTRDAFVEQVRDALPQLRVVAPDIF